MYENIANGTHFGLQAPGNFLGRYWSRLTKKSQTLMPLDSTFYKSRSPVNQNMGAAVIFQRGNKWIECFMKVRMWQEAYGSVAMELGKSTQSTTRWQGGIYSPKNSTQDCEAPANYAQISRPQPSTLDLNTDQKKLGWVFMRQVLVILGIGYAACIAAFVGELISSFTIWEIN